jgi:FlaG/FlaF family flagellin (archaellin)
MVAITVILAAVIGTFVLGLGEQVEQNARAAVSADVDADANQVSLSLTTLDNSDYVVLLGDLDPFDGINTPDGNDTTAAGDGIYLNQTGTSVTAYGSDGDEGTITVIAVIGQEPSGSPANGADVAATDIPDTTTQTTVQTVDYDL